MTFDLAHQNSTVSMSFALRSLVRAATAKTLKPVSAARNQLKPVLATAANFSTSTVDAAPRVQHPAPDFKATAVVNGDFKEIQLSDYKAGQIS